MPRKLTLEIHATQQPCSTEVATEKELLAFANKVRQAGGAGILDALLPSTPGNSKICLIANALNFGCTVEPFENASWGDEDKTEWKDGTLVWTMTFPSSMDLEEQQRIAKEIGCPVVVVNYDSNWDEDQHEWVDTITQYAMKLPKPIGNAADAFDQGVAFNECRKA